MLGFHVHFDQGYRNVENRTSKKILRSAFSVISVYDHKDDQGMRMTWRKPIMAKSRFALNVSGDKDGIRITGHVSDVL